MNRGVALVIAHPILFTVAVWALADIALTWYVERQRTAAIVAETRASLDAQLPTLVPRMRYAVEGEHDLGGAPDITEAGNDA